MPAVAPAQAQGQGADGNIEGTVRDATGAVVPGVTVTIRDAELGTRRGVVTNEQGYYRVPGLPSGTYTLTARMQGFRRFEQRDLPLAAGQTIIANIRLEVGGIELVPADAGSIMVAGEVGPIDRGWTVGSCAFGS